MPKLPGINHQMAVRAFGRLGFVVDRQSGHVIMRKGKTRIVIPRGNPINPFTMAGVIRDAGVTIEQFKAAL